MIVEGTLHINWYGDSIEVLVANGETQPCRNCDGTGRQRYRKLNCRTCRGSGRQAVTLDVGDVIEGLDGRKIRLQIENLGVGDKPAAPVPDGLDEMDDNDTDRILARVIGE